MRLIARCVIGFLALLVASPSWAATPVAPNESIVTAEVLDATIVDSASLGIAPPQPLCVLALKLTSIASTIGHGAVSQAQIGTTITAYSKDLSLESAKGMTVRALMSYGAAGRDGRYWVNALTIVTPEVSR
jgi:hypothetical protein